MKKCIDCGVKLHRSPPKSRTLVCRNPTCKSNVEKLAKQARLLAEEKARKAAEAAKA